MFKNTKAVNSIEEFENQLVNQLTEHYEKYQFVGTPEIKINKGSKFYKIIVGTSVWGSSHESHLYTRVSN